MDVYVFDVTNILMLFRFFLSHQRAYEGVPFRFYGVASLYSKF